MAVFLIAMYAASGTVEGTFRLRRCTAFWTDFGLILGHNLGAGFLLILANTATLGIAGIAFFALNGYLVGRLLDAVPGEFLPSVALFAPL